MKTFLPFFILLSLISSAQSTTPVPKAGFGIDGDLRANFFNNFVQSGGDDWFNTGQYTTGQAVIDTTGAAAIIARYAIDPSFRRTPLFRGMRYGPNSLVGVPQRAWLDAVWIRDYSGAPPGDETAYLGSNKNGASPGVWAGSTVSDWGLVGDKVDIADMMVHVRREGTTALTPLWFFGGLSLQSTSGDRYFDFELYQTDIFYDRTTGTFLNYGPDAGHTTWKFDVNGNILAPGDVIFNCHFGTNGLDLTDGFEARIWVNRASLSMTPANFDWTGVFDGATNSSQYGYATIKPKGTNVYYIGVQSTNNAWPGPFGYIDANNNLQANYAKGQFLEIGVNLTYLGLDPMTILGTDPCGLPFRRILVKTRQSGSFTSNLSDFVGPFDFFMNKPVSALADVPLYCGTVGVSQLSVTNPQSASVYTWETEDGHIVGNNISPSITVDSPGTYIVSMQVLAGCPPSGKDTVTVLYDASCTPMASKLISFKGSLKDRKSKLTWAMSANAETDYFEIQRSLDGSDFQTVGKIEVNAENILKYYGFEDDISGVNAPVMYYRLKIKANNGSVSYSSIVTIEQKSQTEVSVFPNPVKDVLQLSIPSSKQQEVQVLVYDISGSMISASKFGLKEGGNMVQVRSETWKSGVYMVNVKTDSGSHWQKFLVNSSLTK